MTLKNEKRNMIFAGLVIGVIASLLVLFGNPKNMGFCVACFLRDTAGEQIARPYTFHFVYLAMASWSRLCKKSLSLQRLIQDTDYAFKFT